MIEELLEKPETQGKKIFVDTNICIETLHRISDTQHVLVMLADPEIGIHRIIIGRSSHGSVQRRAMTNSCIPGSTSFSEMRRAARKKRFYWLRRYSEYHNMWRENDV